MGGPVGHFSGDTSARGPSRRAQHPPAPARRRARRLRGDGRPGGGRPRRGDDRGGRHRRRLEPAVVRHRRLHHRRLRRRPAGRVRRGRARPAAATPPSTPTSAAAASAPRSRAGCRTTPAAKGIPEIGMPVPVGSPGDRLLEALGYRVRWNSWGLAAARGRGGPGARAARGVRRPRGRPVGVRAGLAGPGGRVPRVVGPRPRLVRGLAGRGHRAARLRAVEPARRGRRRRRRRRDGLGAARRRSRRSSPGSRPRRTERGRGLAQALLVDSFAAGRGTRRRKSELSTDSRTGALALYEKVGMVVTSNWVNRGLVLTTPEAL